MYLLSITEFIAHLHPALVHLPIGILLTALLLQFLARKEKFSSFRPAIPIVLLAGLISAILSCTTGFLLYRSGDYDDTLVSWHMWLAITLTFLSFALYARVAFGHGLDRTSHILGLTLLALISITGHLGGSLTHGEDYLTGAFHTTPPPPVFHPIPDVQKAAAYGDIVKPILESRCYSCHGPNRQKGGLRLDDPAYIAKGGKDGTILLAGRSDSSELIKRLLLPDGDEHHMPPKDKVQLSSREQQLLAWWVDQGADYRKTVNELPQPDKIKPALLALQHAPAAAPTISIVPETPVDPADAKTIDALKKAGVVIMPVSQNSNYLSANFSNTKAGSLIPLLKPIKKQLLQLDLSNTNIDDSAMTIITQCSALRQLSLSHTNITDKTLHSLASLPELRVLNLVGTQITGQGLLSIQPPKHLHALYLYHTHVEAKYWPKLTDLYKNTILDSGGYTLPVLTSDTSIVRPAPKPAEK